jgi:hypothetical protein
MKTRTKQLAERHAILVQQCCAERHLLTKQAQAVQQDLSVANWAWLVIGKVRQYPALSIAGLALSVSLAATLKPRRLFALAKNAFVGWQLVQRVLPLVKNLIQPPNQS